VERRAEGGRLGRLSGATLRRRRRRLAPLRGGGPLGSLAPKVALSVHAARVEPLVPRLQLSGAAVVLDGDDGRDGAAQALELRRGRLALGGAVVKRAGQHGLQRRDVVGLVERRVCGRRRGR